MGIPRSEDFHIFSIDTDGVSKLLERRRPLFSLPEFLQPTYLEDEKMRFMPGRTLGSINGLTLRSPTTLPKDSFALHQWRARFAVRFSSTTALPLSTSFRLGHEDNISSLEKLMILESTTALSPRRSLNFMVVEMEIFTTIPSS